MKLRDGRAADVWTVLVEKGGAHKGDFDMFLSYLLAHEIDTPFEFRFMGHFGFGGKLRTDKIWGTQDTCGAIRFRADYYPENRTPERDRLLATLNEALSHV